METEYTYKVITPDKSNRLNLGEFEKDVVNMHEEIYEDKEDDPVKAFYEYLRSPWSAVVIALDDKNKPVGYGTVMLNGDEGELESSFVLPEHRKKGIYKELTRIREQLVTEKGAHRLKIATLHDEQVPYLLRNGFIKIDDIHYQKQLPQQIKPAPFK